MPKLILASSSPRRVELLKQIGYEPDIIYPADIDETPKHKERPKEYCRRIAHTKALEVSKVYPEDIILAADTINCVGSIILGKPKDRDEAKKFLTLLSGRRHRAYTSVVVAHNSKIRQKTVLTFIKFKRLSPEEIEIHTMSNQWKGKSGGYMIQGLVAAYVKSINGQVTNVIGLPLCETNNLLKAFGLSPRIL